MDGILRCSRYAFGPNQLHYCGPDRNSQLFAHIKEEVVDPDLTRILSQFETMYPYLVHIAAANRIKDPLDDRVVEAYWIGNALLDRVSKSDFYWHLVDGLSLKKKLGKSFALVEEKIGNIPLLIRIERAKFDIRKPPAQTREEPERERVHRDIGITKDKDNGGAHRVRFASAICRSVYFFNADACLLVIRSQMTPQWIETISPVFNCSIS